MKKSVVEKRLYPRVKHRTKIVFEDELGDGLFFVNSTDISMGGLFLESEIPVKVGTMLLLSFILPGHKRPIKVTGRVVRISVQGRDPSVGIGVSFIGLSEIARKRLEDFFKISSRTL